MNNWLQAEAGNLAQYGLIGNPRSSDLLLA